MATFIDLNAHNGTRAVHRFSARRLPAMTDVMDGGCVGHSTSGLKSGDCQMYALRVSARRSLRALVGSWASACTAPPNLPPRSTTCHLSLETTLSSVARARCEGRPAPTMFFAPSTFCSVRRTGCLSRRRSAVAPERRFWPWPLAPWPSMTPPAGLARA